MTQKQSQKFDFLEFNGELLNWSSVQNLLCDFTHLMITYKLWTYVRIVSLGKLSQIVCNASDSARWILIAPFMSRLFDNQSTVFVIDVLAMFVESLLRHFGYNVPVRSLLEDNVIDSKSWQSPPTLGGVVVRSRTSDSEVAGSSPTRTAFQ